MLTPIKLMRVRVISEHLFWRIPDGRILSDQFLSIFGRANAFFELWFSTQQQPVATSSWEEPTQERRIGA